MAGNGLFYPILGLACCLAFIYISFGDWKLVDTKAPKMGFVERNGTQFMVNGRAFYINGWNSYWFMDHAVEGYRKPRVRAMLRAARKMGLTVCRTWAFSDGGYNALQVFPGRFNEQVFKALDHVIAESRQHGIRLLLSLVNNLQAYGGKTQYVKWAWQDGVGLSSSNDSFFYDPSIRIYFKNYIKTVPLQGGPGFECPRPTEASGWIQKACDEFRVILMDQRGTGLSTPLTPSSMSQFQTAEDLANYLKHFRADNIVNDAEFIRIRLVSDAAPWTILGQSYGGFCALTYLSFAPQGLKQVLISGGIPPIGNGCMADSVYRAGLEQVLIQNEKYYKRYPQDVESVQEVVKYLEENGGGVPLPSGGILTPRGLQTLGLSALGFSTGFERLHYLFERAWDPIIVPGAPKRISFFFLNEIDNWIPFGSNPLYALLNESVYCQGASSRWSAERIRNEVGSKFDANKAVKDGFPVYFTGEA